MCSQRDISLLESMHYLRLRFVYPPSCRLFPLSWMIDCCIPCIYPSDIAYRRRREKSTVDCCILIQFITVLPLNQCTTNMISGGGLLGSSEFVFMLISVCFVDGRRLPSPHKKYAYCWVNARQTTHMNMMYSTPNCRQCASKRTWKAKILTSIPSLDGMRDLTRSTARLHITGASVACWCKMGLQCWHYSSTFFAWKRPAPTHHLGLFCSRYSPYYLSSWRRVAGSRCSWVVHAAAEIEVLLGWVDDGSGDGVTSSGSWLRGKEKKWERFFL